VGEPMNRQECDGIIASSPRPWGGEPVRSAGLVAESLPRPVRMSTRRPNQGRRPSHALCWAAAAAGVEDGTVGLDRRLAAAGRPVTTTISGVLVVVLALHSAASRSPARGVVCPVGTGVPGVVGVADAILHIGLPGSACRTRVTVASATT